LNLSCELLQAGELLDIAFTASQVIGNTVLEIEEFLKLRIRDLA
jgi:hypothetical protein